MVKNKRGQGDWIDQPILMLVGYLTMYYLQGISNEWELILN